MSLGKLAIAASTLACAAMLSLGASDQAQARRLYVSPHAIGPYYTNTGLPWYAVRAYYADGPWSGTYYSYTGWGDYATRAGIGCTPGTVVKGGDGILYLCQ